jgi:hypothetical protein
VQSSRRFAERNVIAVGVRSTERNRLATLRAMRSPFQLGMIQTVLTKTFSMVK